MTTQKEWIKIKEGEYRFLLNEKEIGNLQIQLTTLHSKALATIDGQQFTIQRTGFWKSKIEVCNKNGQVVMKTYPEKWYSNTSVLEYNLKKYRLVIRNNPLAEWAILDQQTDVLAYGLATNNNKIVVRITSAVPPPTHLFDFLLWYLFAPIAQEDMGDHSTFQLLLDAS